MEEADKILVPLLQQIGCPLKPDTSSVSQIAADADVLILTIQHIFRTIDKVNNVFPKVLPTGKAARFRIASQLSGLVGALGYKGEHKFESFLYPAEKDVRELLNFLASKLPRSDDKEDDDNDDASGAASVTKQIVDSLAQWSARPWSVLTSEGEKSTIVSTVPLALPSVDETNKDAVRYAAQFQPLLSTQCVRQQLAPSLFELNARDVVLTNEQDKEFEESKDIGMAALRAKRSNAIGAMVNAAFRGAARTDSSATLDSLRGNLNAYAKSATDANSVFGRREAFGQEGDTPATPAPVAAEAKQNEKSEDEQKAELQAEVDKLSDRYKGVLNAVNDLDRTIDGIGASIGPLTAEYAAASQANAKIAEENKGNADALALVPEADKNLAELTRISEASAKRLLDLGEEWERFRLPLVAQYRRKKQLLNDRKDDAAVKLEATKRLREDMKLLAAQIREKEDQLKSVTDELNKLPKAVNRQVYVQRIMNIVKNLEKQKAEIATVLADVRKLQRDINTVSETLQRSFAVADEVVFSVAADSTATGAAAAAGKTRDPTAVQAYKNVVALRTGFERLVQAVADTGRARNEVLDVMTRIESLEARNSSLNMARVTEDLAAVKAENQQLTTRLKALKQSVKK